MSPGIGLMNRRLETKESAISLAISGITKKFNVQANEMKCLETKYDEGQHGGGDSEMLFDIVNNLKVDQSIVHSVEDALESHLMALAAEESRLNDGAIIDMEGFKSRYI